MEALKSFISLYLNWKSAEVLFISCSRFNFFNPGVCLGVHRGARVNPRQSLSDSTQAALTKALVLASNPGARLSTKRERQLFLIFRPATKPCPLRYQNNLSKHSRSFHKLAIPSLALPCITLCFRLWCGRLRIASLSNLIFIAPC